MKISPINFLNTTRSNALRNTSPQNIFNTPCDTVCFSGKKQPVETDFSPEAQEGIAIGKKMLKLAKSDSLTKDAIEKILNEKSPVKITVKDIADFEYEFIGSIGHVTAHMLPLYDTETLHLAEADINLGPIPKTAKEKSQYAAEIAHEYTHVLQRAKDKNYYGLPKYLKNNEEIVKVARASQETMGRIGIICQKEMANKIKNKNKIKELALNNKLDIKKILGDISFSSIINFVSLNLAAELNKDPEEMKKLVKGWIIQETANEKEAYEVSIDILSRTKHDPENMINDKIMKELYGYISDKLKYEE